MVDLVKTYSDKIDSVRELVGIFEIYLKGNAPQPLGVKVWEYSENQYMPQMSHHVQGEDCYDAHVPSFHFSNSIKEAIEDVISHGLMNYNPNRKEDKWEKNINY